MDRIKQRLEKENQKLNGLLQRKEKIEDNIKVSEAKIADYKSMLNQRKFSEVTDVLNIRGLSLDEVMAAIKNGNLLSLQEKLEVNEEHRQC